MNEKNEIEEAIRNIHKTEVVKEFVDIIVGKNSGLVQAELAKLLRENTLKEIAPFKQKMKELIAKQNEESRNSNQNETNE